MSKTRLSRLELQIMDVLWRQGASAVREIQKDLPVQKRPAHTTVQTVLIRLEAKQAVRRTGKISNAHIDEPLVTRAATQSLLVDEQLAFFGGRAAPLMSRLIESGQLTLADVEEARKTLQQDAKP
jgi:predicted transcriptional regulator